MAKRLLRWPIVAIAAMAGLLYSLVSLGGFRDLKLGMDLGIFDQAVKAYANLEVPYIPIKAQAPFNILGDHFSPIIALLAPFYRLWPDVRLLLIAQAILFALGVGLIGWYARKRGLGLAAYLVEACFALSYGVLSAVVFDFHEVAFGLPILVWALIALLEKRDLQLVIACAAMALVKEDMLFFAAGIALVLFFTGRRLFGLILGLASVAVVCLLIFVVIPAFSYWGHYTYIGNGSRGLNSVGAMLSSLGSGLFSVHGLWFLLLIALTAGLGLRSPLMLAVIPTVIFRFLARDSIYLSFRYHYGILLTAVAFMALIDAWDRWKGWKVVTRAWLRRGQGLLLVICAIVGFQASYAGAWVSGLSGDEAMLDQMHTVAAAIPDGANVAADVYLVDQIVDRTTVQVAYSSWKDETGAPINSDYVFLDRQTSSYDNVKMPWVNGLITRLTADGGYQIISQAGPFVLLDRTGD